MTMNVQKSGRQGAPTIVFLHGGGAGAWSWRYQMAALRDEYYCLAPDLPGSAGSPEDGPFTFQRAAAQVMDLIRARAGGGRAHVVGLSLGGQLGAVLLATAPELVDHAVLSGTLVREYRAAGCLTTGWGRGLLRATLAAYWPFRNQTFWIRANMKSYGIPPEFEPEVRAETRAMTIDGFMEMVGNENLGFRLPPGLEQASVPTLVAVGEKEQRVIFDSARDLAAVLPHVRAVVAPGVGHNWSLENPDLFTQMVRAWLADQPLPEALKPL